MLITYLIGGLESRLGVWEGILLALFFGVCTALARVGTLLTLEPWLGTSDTFGLFWSVEVVFFKEVIDLSRIFGLTDLSNFSLRSKYHRLKGICAFLVPAAF